ncbi:MAG: 30S ribosomal protein S5 [Candidatus Omnitrophota bacterium]
MSEERKENKVPEKKNAPYTDKKTFRGEGRRSESTGPAERVIKISRVSKVVKGGKNFSFNAMVVVGDGNGQVGFGLGKSNEVVEAIKKGSETAKKSYIKVVMDGDTIPHEVIGEFKASRVILKPAGPGTGVIAGGPVRALCDAVGIKNVLTKSLGSRNAINVVRAAVNGFSKLRLKRKS